MLQYPRWRLRLRNGTERDAELTDSRRHGERWVVKLQGYDAPETAQVLAGALVQVDRAELPPLPVGEYYQADLLGMQVRNREGHLLGKVDHFIAAPTNAVMAIIGEREYWVPLAKQHLLKVDLAAGEVLVDWPADF